MTLVERLEKCRKELDRYITESIATDTYEQRSADMRELLHAAENRIKELEGCRKN